MDVFAALTRRHYTRLRHYWTGGKRGGGSRTDNLDLALAGAGLITRLGDDPSGVVRFAITPAGEVELAAETVREIERRKPHHSFGARVAAWRRGQSRTTWEGIRIIVDAGQIRQQISPDVLSLNATYDEKRLAPVIDEIKISRADFLNDVNKPEKRAGYALIAEVVNYVVPAGLVDPREVPPECGLIEEVAPGQFSIVYKPKKRTVVLNTHTLMNLVLKHGTLPETYLV